FATATDTEKYPNGRLPDSAKFSVEESIHAFTWKNAERMRLLDKIGSIEVGKRACLVVLDKDIFTIPDEEISTIDPVCHYFDGEELHIPNPLKQ
ncbi:MAG: amidohydrolase family protein, partial [Clostridia bacterium]|nr:amidohydrolase family protein [Clostridia bacterium]